MNTKKIISIATGLALAASVALPAFAQININAGVNADVNANGGWQGQGRSSFAPGHMMGRPDGKNATSTRLNMMRPAVSGTVTAISGNTITISGRTGFSSTTATVTYTIDATNATVRKNNATSTVSSIAVGDKIFAQGTVSGTNVTATAIMDGIGMMGRGNGQMNGGRNGDNASSTSPFLGNGQPVVAGTVSVVSGNSLTITTASNITYTVDATNAKIVKGPNTTTISTIVVGDKVLVQGAVNGTSVIASTVVDQSGQPGNRPGDANGSTTPERQAPKGFFSGIGQFFSHLFGF